MGLRVADGYQMLAVPLQVILLNVFARSLVEVVFQVHELVCD